MYRRVCVGLVLLAGCDGQIFTPAPGSSSVVIDQPGPGSGSGGGDVDLPPTDSMCVPAAAVACSTGSTPQRVWALSRREFDASVAAALQSSSKQAQSTFPFENRRNGFSSNPEAVVFDTTLVTLLMNAAEAIATERAAAERAAITCSLSTAPKASPIDTCAQSFIASAGRRLFRRPLTAAESSGLYSVYLVGFGNPDDGQAAALSGVQTVLAAMLQSPSFLYRTELGDAASTAATVPLTPYEAASALSYLTTGGAPDAALMQLADSSALSDPAVIEAQVRRLLATPAGKQQLARFVLEWVGADRVASQGGAAGPLTPAIAAGMFDESRAFVQHVLFSSTGTVNELLTANYTFLNHDLATYYGVSPAPNGSAMQQVPLDTTRRLGLLSQGSFLSASGTTGVPILKRGHAIRGRVLCQSLPSFASLGLSNFTPPPLTSPAAGQSRRQQLSVAIPTGSMCATCHQYFMPLGFAFEHFDTAGQYRTADNGSAVDGSGALLSPTSIDPHSGLINTPQCHSEKPFADLPGLATELGESDEVSRCFAQQLLTWSSGRADVARDECGLQASQARSTSGTTVVDGFVELVKSGSFLQRSR